MIVSLDSFQFNRINYNPLQVIYTFYFLHFRNSSSFMRDQLNTGCILFLFPRVNVFRKNRRVYCNVFCSVAFCRFPNSTEALKRVSIWNTLTVANDTEWKWMGWAVVLYYYLKFVSEKLLLSWAFLAPSSFFPFYIYPCVVYVCVSVHADVLVCVCVCFILRERLFEKWI